jgi:tetratricopeptide (TPR) repeat protein
VELEEARAAQDRSGLLARLTNRLRAALVNAEVARADKPPASDASAIEFWLYGRHVWAKDLASLRGALESRKLYDQALRLDPSLVPALVSKAGTLVYELYFNPRADHDRLVQEMDELSFRAVSIDDQYPPAWDLRGIVLGLQWRWEAALEANAIARRLDPTRDDATITERAELMFFMGRPTEALALVDQALALEPSGVIGISWPLDIRCRAYMALGRNDEAIAACEKSVGELDWWMPHLYLIAAYTHTGDAAKAAAEKAKLLQQRPGISIADFKALRLSNDPAFLQQTETHLFADLRKAGIPEN